MIDPSKQRVETLKIIVHLDVEGSELRVKSVEDRIKQARSNLSDVNKQMAAAMNSWQRSMSQAAGQANRGGFGAAGGTLAQGAISAGKTAIGKKAMGAGAIVLGGAMFIENILPMLMSVISDKLSEVLPGFMADTMRDTSSEISQMITDKIAAITSTVAATTGTYERLKARARLGADWGAVASQAGDIWSQEYEISQQQTRLKRAVTKDIQQQIFETLRGVRPPQ